MPKKKRGYIKSPKLFRKKGELKSSKGRKAKSMGERISFLIPKKRGKENRVSGKVIGVHKEFYDVIYRNTAYRVNRNSIYYSLGYYTGRVSTAIIEMGKSAYAGVKHETAKAKAFRKMKGRGIQKQITKYANRTTVPISELLRMTKKQLTDFIGGVRKRRYIKRGKRRK